MGKDINNLSYLTVEKSYEYAIEFSLNDSVRKWLIKDNDGECGGSIF